MGQQVLLGSERCPGETEACPEVALCPLGGPLSCYFSGFSLTQKLTQPGLSDRHRDSFHNLTSIQPSATQLSTAGEPGSAAEKPCLRFFICKRRTQLSPARASGRMNELIGVQHVARLRQDAAQPPGAVLSEAVLAQPRICISLRAEN